MRLSVISLLSIAALSSAQGTQPAPVVADNPLGAVYVAQLPDNNRSTVRGSFRAASAANGRGVDFQVAITGLPTSGGPFLYHLHDQPVPSNGNCTATLAHLDPFKRGETPPCDPAQKATCQVGDLSGKYGKINGTSLVTSYNDLYASLKPGIGAFFGNRSIVVHYNNATRITCANFTLVSGGGPGRNATGNTTYTGVPSPTVMTKPTGTNSASNSAMIGTGAVLAAIFAFIL